MRFRLFTDHGAFSRHVIDYLLRNESTNNILLSMVDDPHRTANAAVNVHEFFMCTIDRSGRPVFVGVRRPGFHLVINGDHEADIIACTVDGIVAQMPELKGVIGPRPITEAFAERYEHVTRVPCSIEMEQLIYELVRVEKLTLAPGRLRLAGPSDTPLLIEWFAAFQRDIGSPRGSDHIRDRVLGMIARKNAYIWEYETRPVSLALHSRSTRNGATISGVFTPPEYRGRGFATACVSSVSNTLLESGYSHCCLYTDANFPTSNRIYKRIGYAEIAASIVYRFPSREP
jgi:uncharacterized protein